MAATPTPRSKASEQGLSSGPHDAASSDLLDVDHLPTDLLENNALLDEVERGAAG